MLERIGEFIVDAVDRKRARLTLLLVIFVVFGGINFAVGVLISITQLPMFVHASIDAAVLGGSAALAAWLLLKSTSEHRARIRAQVRESARLNHEIRNALEVIGQAGYLINDVVYGRAIFGKHRPDRKRSSRTHQTRRLEAMRDSSMAYQLGAAPPYQSLLSL